MLVCALYVCFTSLEVTDRSLADAFRVQRLIDVLTAFSMVAYVVFPWLCAFLLHAVIMMPAAAFQLCVIR
jgi:hypothetical protein